MKTLLLFSLGIRAIFSFVHQLCNAINISWIIEYYKIDVICNHIGVFSIRLKCLRHQIFLVQAHFCDNNAADSQASIGVYCAYISINAWISYPQVSL